jgi:hypothetical protein
MKRNKELFYEIADIIDFKPELYAQAIWGGFVPTEGGRIRMHQPPSSGLH